MKKAKTTVEKMFERKFKKDFDARNPTNELMQLIKDERLSKSRWFNPDTKGKLLTELSLEQLEYIAFRLENGSHKLHIIAELYYFIRLYLDLENQGLNEDDFEWALTEHFGSEFNVVKKRVKTREELELDREIKRQMEKT